MRVVNVLMRGMRIGAGHHVHAQFPAALRHFAECVSISEIFAAIVKRNLRGIERHASARRETRGIGMDAAKVIEPELRVVMAGIVFDERQLHPAHGPPVPFRLLGSLEPPAMLRAAAEYFRKSRRVFMPLSVSLVTSAVRGSCRPPRIRPAPDRPPETRWRGTARERRPNHARGAA